MITEEDIQRLKEIFMPRAECNTQMDTISAKLSDDKTRLAVIENQLKLILWVLAAVGSGVIAMLIKMFWGV